MQKTKRQYLSFPAPPVAPLVNRVLFVFSWFDTFKYLAYKSYFPYDGQNSIRSDKGIVKDNESEYNFRFVDTVTYWKLRG